MLGFDLGSNLQQVDVLVSTALSEFWAVGPGGCLPSTFPIPISSYIFHVVIILVENDIQFLLL
jgi:hypothetical protein